jgi:hypothetical protein
MRVFFSSSLPKIALLEHFSLSPSLLDSVSTIVGWLSCFYSVDKILCKLVLRNDGCVANPKQSRCLAAVLHSVEGRGIARISVRDGKGHWPATKKTPVLV